MPSFHHRSSYVISLSLGLKCPFTTIHESCGGAFTPTNYDCICEDNFFDLHLFQEEHGNQYAGDGCMIVHYSTNEINYNEMNHYYRDNRNDVGTSETLTMISHHLDHVEWLSDFEWGSDILQFCYRIFPWNFPALYFILNAGPFN